MSLLFERCSAIAHLYLGLSFIGTDPDYERRGAASLLIMWGQDRCRRENVPAYLESTIEAGPLYKRHGFEAVETISLALKATEDEDLPTIYQEIGFLFRP